MLKELSYIPYIGFRQLKWLFGDRSYYAVIIKITYRCNLKCLHCPWYRKKSSELSTDKWKARVDELRDNGAIHFIIEGGEPTLREDLAELINHIREQGGKVTLITNGTNDLTTYTPDRFIFSVEGLPETHDRIRGKGTYNRMRDNMKNAKSAKHSLVTLSRFNYEEIPAMMDPLLDYLDGFWFSFIYDYKGNDPMGLSTDQIRKTAQRILGLMDRYPIINNPFTLSRAGTSRPCHPWVLATITPDGKEVGDCMVKEIESYECDRCELSCHREASDFVNPRLYLYHLFRYLNKPIF